MEETKDQTASWPGRSGRALLVGSGWCAVLLTMLNTVVSQAAAMQIAAGFGHTVMVKQDGTLWAWGSNNAGQLGDGTTADKNSPVRVGSANDWVVVAAGLFHVVAVKRDGTL